MSVFVVSGRDPDHPNMVMKGETVDAAAQDPSSMGKVLVDMAAAEHGDLSGHALYYERNTSAVRMLERWESGMEDLLTGGWVRVLSSPNQYRAERPRLQAMIERGDAVDHGVYRGVRLVEFCAKAKAA